MDAPLHRELGCFRSRLPTLLAEHEGKYVLIQGEELCGVFDSETSAVNAGYDRFGPVPFFVRRVVRAESPPGLVFSER